MKITRKLKHKICDEAEDLLNAIYKMGPNYQADVFCTELYVPQDPDAEVTLYRYKFTVNITERYNHSVTSYIYSGFTYDCPENLGKLVFAKHISTYPVFPLAEMKEIK